MTSAAQIGLSSASLAGMALDQALACGRRLGFEAVEILGFEGERHSQGDLCGFEFAERAPADLEALRGRLAGYRQISVHAPFILVPLLATNPGIRREAFRQVAACVRGIATAGGATCTVHLNGAPFWRPDEWRRAAVRVLGELGAVGAECGVTVALETGCPATEEEYCALLEEANHPWVGACIDTGHIMHYYPQALKGTAEGVAQHNDILNRVVARLGARVVVFHVHDNRQADHRDHRAPGRGIIDWPRLLRTIRQTGLRAPLLLELEEPDFEAALLAGKQCLLDALAGPDLAGTPQSRREPRLRTSPKDP